MMRENLLIVGAGAYAQVAAEIAADMGIFQRVAFVDDNVKILWDGSPVAGTTSDIERLAEEYGAEYSQMGDYPAWEYRADSKLRDLMVETYARMFGAEPKVVAIHAGLECGLLSEKIEGLDCVSIGPDMEDIHTSREKLDIASTARTWEFLQEVLFL